jgi:hypothetical protein
MKALQLELPSGQWRLFIDSSKVSMKTVLLHFPSFPLAHAVHMQETYKNHQVLLKIICYEESWWHICADLKVKSNTDCAARQIHQILLLLM